MELLIFPELLIIAIHCSGQTRLAAGPRSEGLSYWLIAEELKRRNNTLGMVGNERIVTEEYARDSYENLLFSICRFYEVTGQYPTSITVIGFDFKRKRFQEIHLPSIRYPIDRYSRNDINNGRNAILMERVM